MKNRLKTIIVCAFIMLILAGCSMLDEAFQPRLMFVHYPDHVTAEEEFLVKGKYETYQPGNENVTVIFTVRIKGDDSRGVYTEEMTFKNQTQIFQFDHVVLSNVDEDLYFEFKLLLDGKLILTTNTKDGNLPSIWHTNITTTYFNPTKSDGSPAYGTWMNDLTQENPFYFALPYRDFYYYVWNSETGEKELKKKDYFGKSNVKNQWIEIYYPEQDVYAYAQWEDVGPWNYYDPYYVFSIADERPYAEIGIDMGWSDQGYRETNYAGLDISPTVMKYLTGKFGESGSPSVGKIMVNWRFISSLEVPNGPWKNNVSTTAADVNILNLETQTLRTLE